MLTAVASDQASPSRPICLPATIASTAPPISAMPASSRALAGSANTPIASAAVSKGAVPRSTG
jgi:hypothetical protein